jgi:hypothetical protein
MSLLLQNQEPDLNQFKKRVRNSYSGRLFSQSNQPEYPQADLEMALQVDRFSFAQKIIKQDGLLVVQPYFDTSIG